MGCNNSSSIKELEDNQKDSQKNNNNSSDKNNSLDKDEDQEMSSKKNTKDNDSDKKEANGKKKPNEKEKKKGEKIVLSTEENKDENKDMSNIMTEGVANDKKKLNYQKQQYEGVMLMKGIEECIPENLNEDDIYQLVEDSLYGNKSEDDSKDPNKLTKEQKKAISSILYNKIHNKGKINIKDYPMLDGMNIKIGYQKLTREVIRNMMFNNKKVDDCQIDLTYANLTKDNDDIKALTIEIMP
jgi:hypothetical protein